MTRIPGVVRELAFSMHSTTALEPTHSKLKVLRGKRILLISPQPWKHLQVSKHHYAEELAHENDVVFLEPPETAGFPRLTLKPHLTLARLQVASWTPFTPKVLRFHAYPLYRAAMRINAAWIAKHLGGVDVVWCFDFNVFPDLDSFGASVRIFHPVDPLNSKRQAAIANSSDLVVSVSDRILSNFTRGPAKDRLLIVNHGLSGPFSELSSKPAPERRAGPIRCGYFGNLERAIIHFELLARTIRAHPEVEFHFWGPFATDGTFASQIAPLPNVTAYGSMEKIELARRASEMDLFMLAYLDHPTESDRSNAHKLLEYMSTGRPIVATRMDCYAQDVDLVQMSQSADDSDFPGVFRSTLDQVQALNSPELIEKRKKYCRQFTYSENVARIDAALSGIPVFTSTSNLTAIRAPIGDRL